MDVPEPGTTWAEVGLRVARARAAEGLSQADLSARAGIDPGTIAAVEAGQRPLPAHELLRIAQCLRQPLDWFVLESPPQVVSHRSEWTSSEMAAVGLLIDRVARDAEQLQDLRDLRLAEPEILPAPLDLHAAELRAAKIRQVLGVPDGPLTDLARHGEHLGLLTFSKKFGGKGPDGCYMALGQGGIAVIDGSAPAGRRRFTLAHEIGHHVFKDAYATDWLAEGLGGEKLINAFAVHLLLPRRSLIEAWSSYTGSKTPRVAAIRLAVEYRVSWTPLCNQLHTLELVDSLGRDQLISAPPKRVDFMELELEIVEEISPPYLSPAYSAAVVRSYRHGKIGRGRAVEMLWHTLSGEDLPEPDTAPLESLRSELLET